METVQYAAKLAYQTAIRRGELIPDEVCERCGGVPCLGMKRLDGHHDDYSRPLDVRWLCRPCHRRVHLEAA